MSSCWHCWETVAETMIYLDLKNEQQKAEKIIVERGGRRLAPIIVSITGVRSGQASSLVTHFCATFSFK